MSAGTPATSVRSLQGPRDFSLVLGGPLFQFFRRAHLSDDELMLARQRVIVISLFAWLPLLLLSAVQGQAFHGSVAVPFLLDFDVHLRFLVAMPLLIGAEIVVHRRMVPVVKQFVQRNLVPESAMARFDSAIGSALRLRNSALAGSSAPWGARSTGCTTSSRPGTTCTSCRCASCRAQARNSKALRSPGA